MTFYDDGESAAIEVARIALGETEDAPGSAAIHEVTMNMQARHGSDGVAALVVALARQYASALAVVASFRDTDALTVLDDFEHHKLRQIDLERHEEGDR